MYLKKEKNTRTFSPGGRTGKSPEASILYQYSQEEPGNSLSGAVTDTNHWKRDNSTEKPSPQGTASTGILNTKDKGPQRMPPATYHQPNKP